MKYNKLLKTAAIFTAITLMAGCTNTPAETEERDNNEEETVVETEETTEEAEETEETDIDLTDNASVFSIEENHANWRAFIENFDDNGYYYSFNSDSQLRVDDGNGTVTLYDMSNDGEVSVSQEFTYEFHDGMTFTGLTYEDLLNCPVFTYWGYSSTVTFDNNLPDGEYYGFVMAISDDGTTLYARLGEPVIITNELLDESDPDQFFFNYHGTIVRLDYTVSEIERPEEGESYVFHSPDGSPVTVNERLVIIPFAEDAVISSNASEYGVAANEGNNVMTSSDTWTFLTEFSPRIEHIDNWYRARYTIIPATVEDGEITEISFIVAP